MRMSIEETWRRLWRIYVSGMPLLVRGLWVGCVGGTRDSTTESLRRGILAECTLAVSDRTLLSRGSACSGLCGRDICSRIATEASGGVTRDVERRRELWTKHETIANSRACVATLIVWEV